MINISYAKAINLALKESMKDNKSVFCIGEDVGFGGAYGATQNLREQFGHDRVRDTPISESAIIVQIKNAVSNKKNDLERIPNNMFCN